MGRRAEKGQAGLGHQQGKEGVSQGQPDRHSQKVGPGVGPGPSGYGQGLAGRAEDGPRRQEDDGRSFRAGAKGSPGQEQGGADDQQRIFAQGQEERDLQGNAGQSQGKRFPVSPAPSLP